MKLSLISITQ